MAVKPDTAPGSAWEVSVRWGSRRLSSEVLDRRGRTALSLGDRPEDDIATGSPARLRFAWRDGQLDVRFSSGVVGTAALRGDAPASLSQLAASGAVAEGSEGFSLTLSGADTVTLTVGALQVHARQVKGRFPRLPLDSKALAVLGLVLAVFVFIFIMSSVLAPNEGPKLHWLKRK